MMMKSSQILVALLIAMGGVACVQDMEPPKTQLQIREFQTRAYQTNDMKMALKAVLNVLQDDGYIVKQADSDLGFLTAAKEVDVASGMTRFFAAFSSNHDNTWASNKVIECTCNVTVFNDQETRVRVNFLSKVMNNKGGVEEVRQIDDPVFYQDFFAKVDKGIFIAKEKL